MRSVNRAVCIWVILYAVLAAFSNLHAYTTARYVKLGLSEEASQDIASSPAAGETQVFAEIVESIHRQVNEFRHAQGRQPLRLNPIISAQARQHSLAMARTGSAISHKGFEDRLEKISEQLSFQAGAENVASSTGYDTPARTAVEGWKTSAGHRKNMLGDFTLTGIGIAQSEQGKYFITQIFLKTLQQTERQ